MSFNEQEGTCSCTLRRSSTTQDIAREVSTTTAYSIGFVVVGLSYGKSKQPSAMVDTRWKGMAGQTVKCGNSSCYAFCSL
ncbi:hypothetical protein TIFTF001_046006 [Ficus carica]|uniref:Uncharacterized protein n=1 Tax=Ficus carica TaxID=3494 RepID=A0AA88CQH6_FICCA|nr:hypothetical protein TIFTF001_051466 [Ficus carica]GMN25961.1 hypothetical protein TIFTF001_046006 [Ficus carica]